MKATLFVLLASIAPGCGSARPPAGASSAEGSITLGDHHVTVNGIDLAYHVAGTGPLVVVWPGGAGMDWKYMRMPDVEQHATLLNVEPIGTGQSGRLADPAGYTLARDVEDLEALRRALGLDKLLLLGHSFGGAVALSFALAHQDRVTGLILLDTVPTMGADWQTDVAENIKWFESQPWFADAMAAEAAMPQAETSEAFEALLRREAGFYFFDYSSHKAQYDAFFAEVRFSVEAGARMASPFDVRAQLAALQVPTLIVVGIKDAICSPKFARQMNEKIAGSKLVVLEHSGHLGHIEEPQALSAAIDAFVR